MAGLDPVIVKLENLFDMLDTVLQFIAPEDLRLWWPWEKPLGSRLTTESLLETESPH